MRNWIRLQKLKSRLRKVENEHKKFQATEKYKKLSIEDKRNEDSIFYQIDYVEIYEEIEEIKTKFFLSKVRRYGIPCVSWWDDKKEEYWKKGDYYERHYLSVNGYYKLRYAIRDEQKARREAIVGWTPLITAVVGLLGIITGLLSIIKYWHK